ncbi:MAG TPA: DedA family protein [Terriglobales bacterium]|nr:DedA family protein [Terriglobales bacterium]
MALYVFDLIRAQLVEHGYWTVALALLLENAGLPLPGETILLLASFLAYSEHRLALPYIILVGVIAATLGDNLGFLVGFHGGRPLLARYSKTLHVSPESMAKGENLFARYGAATILVARFIAGLRVIAGPLAGVMRMNWRTFALCNFLGAAVWVTVISSVGYFFGKHWDRLTEVVKDVNVGLLAAAGVVVVMIWLRRRRKR